VAGLIWLLARPRLIAVLLIVTLLLSWVVWEKHRTHKLEALAAQVAAQKRDIAIARQDNKNTTISATLATIARHTNDVAIPNLRERTRARVERAKPSVGMDQGKDGAAVGDDSRTDSWLRDDTEAVADYVAAADKLRGKSAR